MTLQLQEEDFETSTSILSKTLVSLLFFEAFASRNQTRLSLRRWSPHSSPLETLWDADVFTESGVPWQPYLPFYTKGHS